jgi:hypothetical protein
VTATSIVASPMAPLNLYRLTGFTVVRIIPTRTIRLNHLSSNGASTTFA